MKKVVLVTGASKGIGKAIAIRFAKAGYSVVVNYNSDEVGALATLEEVNKYSDGIILKADVSKENDINNMYKTIMDKYNTIDVLVNNAGIAIDSDVDDKTFEDFNKVLNTNLVGPFFLSRLIGNYMKDDKKGAIINIASTNGIDTISPYSLDYDASKAGLISLTHNLAEYYSPYVRVNCVCPGWVNTPMNKDLDPEYVKDEVSKIKLGRFAEPEEIANVVCFLASDEASYVNDSIIRVDGGEIA